MNDLNTALDEVLEEALIFDSLDQAGKITGHSYKEDELTSTLGFLLAQDNNKQKDQLLKDRNDTVFSMGFDEYEAVVLAQGFEKVYTENFLQCRYPSDLDQSNRPEVQCIYVKRDEGLILVVDSFTWHLEGGVKKDRNGATLYFNLKVGTWEEYLKKDTRHSLRFSGGYRRSSFDADEETCEYAICGTIDAREALVFHLDKMRKLGKFLPVWWENPFMYWVHHGHRKNNNEEVDYKKITCAVFEKLPKDVKAIMNHYVYEVR